MVLRLGAKVLEKVERRVCYGLLVFSFVVMAATIAQEVGIPAFGQIRKGYPVPIKNPEAEQVYDMREGTAEAGALRWRVCVYDGLYPRYWRVPFLHRWGGLVARLGAPNLADGEGMRVSATRPGAYTHRINAATPAKAAALLRDLEAKARQEGAQVQLVAVMDHGERAGQHLGEALVDEAFLSACRDLVAWEGATGLVLFGCEVGAGGTGKEYLRLLARSYGMTVWGSAQVVGQSNGEDGGPKGVMTYRDVWRATRDGAEPQKMDDAELQKQLPLGGSPAVKS